MRRELRYPPFARLVRVLVQGTNEKKVRDAAERLAAKLRPALAPSDELLGPSPAPLFRLKGRFRVHLLVKAAELGPARARLCGLIPSVSRPLQASIDIDPVNLM